MVSGQSLLVGKAPSPPVSRVLILGAKGRLGATLTRAWSVGHSVASVARPEVDTSDLPALEKFLQTHNFDVLVNATAMTNVDECEVQKESATVVNAQAPAVMAQVAASRGARFIHISTDYVFDGLKTDLYTENDTPHPISHYGRTKLAGENETLAASSAHLVVRVSWVFGPDKPSFVDSLIDRASSQEHVEAVGDKTASPTYTEDVAIWLAPFLNGPLPGGIYHACNTGSCSWRDYGQHALDWAHRSGLPLRTRTVNPIPLAAMKQFVASRPPHTSMSTARLASVTGITPRTWQNALDDYLTKKFRHAPILPSSI